MIPTIPRPVRALLRASLWPMGNTFVAQGLELSLYASLKVQALRYYHLGARRPNCPHSKDAYYTAYRDRDTFRLMRGFYTLQAIPAGGRVLNIGCGEGFYDWMFYSSRASHIDAVDITPDTIRTAERFHRAPTVHFHCLDAVVEPFPSDGYDVVAMDGCIAHFRPEGAATLLAKIRDAMSDRSLYVGSERLERPEQRSHDHFQAWPTARHMQTYLEQWFPYVQTWQEDLGGATDVFFRCARSPVAFERFVGLGTWPDRSSA